MAPTTTVNETRTMVWIDHNEARIFHFGPELTSTGHATVKAGHSSVHLHHKANERSSGHLPVDHHYLESVTTAVASSGLVLITGPASAKRELADHIAAKHPGLAGRIAGVEPLDHPTDGELQNFGRDFFRKADQLARIGASGLGGPR